MNERKRQISGQMQTQRPVVFQRERTVQLGTERYDIVLDEAQDVLMVRFDDGSEHAHHVTSEWVPGDLVWRGAVDGDAVACQVRPMLNGMMLSRRGADVEARVYTRREAALAALMPEKRAVLASKALLCPMPGLVKSILVREGQEVKAGEPLCMVEAMKMENMLRAERDATVSKIVCKEGDSLAVDAVIMQFA
jgi:propionyl-CoA carboxylase alpha chain